MGEPRRASATTPDQHPFVAAPHRTLALLSLPVLLSLVAEPITGLVDTAFVARLGAEPLAALGVGTIVLSSVFWIFNFLGIATQTEVARADGAGEGDKARQATTLALLLAAGFGLAMLATAPLAGAVAAAMGAEGGVRAAAVTYLRIRLFGAPAVLATTAAFGALRGRQDMRSPLFVAVVVNVLNIALDAALIPRFGVAGAAWATTASQWLGVALAVAIVARRLGLTTHVSLADAGRLLVVGGDLFLRTALLSAFLILTTRTATRIGADAGAAHQAIRQIWMLTALVLDAFAATAQSLVGYFLGARRVAVARRVAGVATGWSLGTGTGLAMAMVAGEGLVAAALVPPSARAVFHSAWLAAALAQPLNALSFATDGIHWGTGDFRFLRNAMFLSTAIGTVGLALVDTASPRALLVVWVVTAIWITLRAGLGAVRVWPGIGGAPLTRLSS